MQLKQFDADSEGKKDGEGNGWDTGDDLANGELPGREILNDCWPLHAVIKHIQIMR